MSLFGNNSSGSSLFSSAANQSNQQRSNTFGGFGSSSAQPASTQSSSLFGSSVTAQPQQSTGGLFGSAFPSQSTSTNLFGGNSASQPQQSGGLFGSAPSSQPQQSSNSFGSTANPQQNLGAGLFGSTQNQTQPQQQTSGGLFSNANNTNNQNSGSLFGYTQPKQTPPSQFGSTLRSSGLTMGQGASQTQQQVVPGVRIDVSNIRGTTRFNDLHEDLQKSIEQIDAFIQQQIAFREQCEALMPSHEQTLSTIPDDVDYVKTQLETTESTLENDGSAIALVKGMVKQDVDEARTSFQAVENLKLPQQFQYAGMWNRGSSSRSAGQSDSSTDGQPADLLSYFSNAADTMLSTLNNYQGSLGQIETYLTNVERQVMAQSQQMLFKRGNETASRGKDDHVRELQMLLTSFEGGVLRTAERIGSVRESVSDLIESGDGQR